MLAENVNIVGLAVQSHGQRFLVNDRGWTALDGLPPGTRISGWVRATGRYTSLSNFNCCAIEMIEIAGDRRPSFYVRPPREVLEAGRLRAAVHNFMAQREYIEIMLPSAWRRSEEYGVPEISLAHEEAKVKLPNLLQSPELPVCTALASGLDRWYSFARCWRLESDPSAAVDGNHLMEFEQLIVGGVATNLEEMMNLCDELVITLASVVGVELLPEDFLQTRMPSVENAAEVPESIMFGAVTVLELGPRWGLNALAVLANQLQSIDAHVLVVDNYGETTAGIDALRNSSPRRVIVQVGDEYMPKLQQIAETMSRVSGELGDDSIRDAMLREWAPLWRVEPSLEWGEHDITDSRLSVRSFTSKRVERSGTTRIRDAQLSLGGIDVAHIGEIGGREDFLMSLSDTNLQADAERFDYFLTELESAPPGMGEISFGWERLCSVLIGANEATSCQLFPRNGDGTALGVSPTIY